MRRPAPDLAVTPTMLRHFAILTVAITACIAMFADGESRQDFEQKLADRQSRSQALKAERQKAATRTTMAGGLVIAKGTRLQSGGEDIVSDGASGGSGGGSGSSELGGLREPRRPMLAASPPAIAGVPNPVQGYMPMIPGVDGLATDLGPDGKPRKGKFISRAQLRPPAGDGEGSRSRSDAAVPNADGIVE